MPQSTTDLATVLTEQRIGRRQSLTREGYLLCEEVPIARVGELMYKPEEIPSVTRGDSPFVVATRDANELFSPETIASFEGKPVTNDHPPELLDASSWASHAAGHVFNVRRGENMDAQYLLCDMLITDSEAIKDVKGDKREVSCGYVAEYEELRPGYCRQTLIRGNHVALVWRGRCGPSCSIRDTAQEIEPMAAKPAAPKPGWMDRIRHAFKTRDAAALERELKTVKSVKDEAPPEQMAGQEPEEEMDPVEAIMSRLDAIEERLSALETGEVEEARDELPEGGEKEEPPAEQPGGEGSQPPVSEKAPDEEDEVVKTMDSASLTALYTDTVARAEILSPGVTIPPRGATPRATMDAVVTLQRLALGNAAKAGALAQVVRPVVTSDVAKLRVRDLGTTFIAASELAKAHNKMKGSTADNAPPNVGGCSPQSYQAMIAAKRRSVKPGGNS